MSDEQPSVRRGIGHDFDLRLLRLHYVLLQVLH